MKVWTLASLDYNIMEPNYKLLGALGQDFLAFKGLPPTSEEIVDCRGFSNLLAWLFKKGETEDHKGVINDFLALLNVLGIESQPILLVKDKDSK